ARTPWWLLLVRLLLCAALIVALAGPIYRPSAESVPGTGPLLIAVDNGWASAPAWKGTIETAHRINRLAAEAGRPVALIATADTTTDLAVVKPPLGSADALSVPVIRRDSGRPAGGFVRASDIKGRTIGDAPFTFPAGATSAEAKFTLPVELRNDVARIEIVGA